MKWWYQFVYNFELINEIPEKQAFIFKCKYLKNNLCSITGAGPFYVVITHTLAPTSNQNCNQGAGL